MSTSADNDLNTGYEYLRNQDYKQCRRLIEKKLPKLKSEIDKINFKLLKLLLLHKTRSFKQAINIKDEILLGFKSNNELNVNENLLTFLVKILREACFLKEASEVYRDFYVKRINISLLDKDKKTSLLKEMILNEDYQEAYKTLTKNMIPTESDSQTLCFYQLIKYELVFEMTFKFGMLSNLIAKMTFKEMLKNKEELRKERGFSDLFLKYLLQLNDDDEILNFNNESKGSKGSELYTNADMKSIVIDIYLKRNEYDKVKNEIFQEIDLNKEKFIYDQYERLVNFLVFLEKDLIFNGINVYQTGISERILKDGHRLKEKEELIEEEGSSINIISMIGYFYRNFISFFDEPAFFNCVKSSVISILSLIYNISRLLSSNFLFSKEVFHLLSKFLKKLTNKHVVLTEIKEFFKLLDWNQRQILFSQIENEEFPSSSKVNRKVFVIKLKRILFNLNISDDQSNSEEILSSLIEDYVQFSQKEETSPEKGERLDSDEYVLLINHVYQSSNFKFSEKIRNSMLLLNQYAHFRSPYNYDISIFLLTSYLSQGLYSKSIQTFKYLNLKGPQHETLSFIVFNDYFNKRHFRTGINLLIENFKKHENENRLSTKKVIWKMMKGRNFFSIGEVFDFQLEANRSLYKWILLVSELSFGVDESIFSSNEEKGGVSEMYDVMIVCYEEYCLIREKGGLVRNQDLLVVSDKYGFVMESSQGSEGRDEVITREKYRYDIDYVNKQGNCLYKDYPSYKNSYIPSYDRGIFGKYGSEDYVKERFLRRILHLLFFKRIQAKEMCTINKKIEIFFEEYKKCSSDKISFSLLSLIKEFSVESSELKVILSKEESILRIKLVLFTYLCHLNENFTSKSLMEVYFYEGFIDFYLVSLLLKEIIYDYSKEFKENISLLKTILSEIKTKVYLLIDVSLSGSESTVNQIDLLSCLENEKIRSVVKGEDLKDDLNFEKKENLKTFLELTRSRKAILKSVL